MKSSNRSVVINSVRRIVPRSTGAATYMINNDQNLWLNQVEWNQLLSSAGLNRNAHTSAVIGCTVTFIQHEVAQSDITAGTNKVKLAVARRRSDGTMQDTVTFTTPGIKRTGLELKLDGEFRTIAKGEALKQPEQPQYSAPQRNQPANDSEEEEFTEDEPTNDEEPEILNEEEQEETPEETPEEELNPEM